MNQQPGERRDRERAVMDVVRRQIERDAEPQPRRTWQHLAALGVALLVSGTLFLGFDLFLTAMQKFMAIEPAEQVAEPVGPVPVFAVPGNGEAVPEVAGVDAPATPSEPSEEPWLPALIEQQRTGEATDPAATEPTPEAGPGD
ncbi:MAG TPA: hypothetical protein VLM41_08370 [Steroidobacteraceae bacterium]|nr:hypothetical protein [Steroidobacteraceae bacterium]